MPGGRPKVQEEDNANKGEIELTERNSTFEDEDDSESEQASLEIDDAPTCCTQGCDLDYICSYSTSKIVFIQHFALGGLNTALTLSIVIIVFLVMIVATKTQYKMEYPILTSRLLVHDIEPAFATSPTNLKYCSQRSPCSDTITCLQCLEVEKDLIIYPNTGNLFGIVTRARSVHHTNVPVGINDPWGNSTGDTSTSDYYYNYGVENVVFHLDHAMSIPVFGPEYSVSGFELEGGIYKQVGEIAHGGGELGEYKKNEKTLITLKMLLDAANMDINALDNYECPYGADKLRECGLALDVVINYHQTSYIGLNQHDFAFEIWVTPNYYDIPNSTGYSTSRTVPLKEDEFLTYEYNAVQIRVYASGTIGKIEIWQCMLTFMASLVFLSMCQKIVDFLMLNVLKEWKMYFFMKFEITADVEELFKAQRLQGTSKKHLLVEAAKAQSNPQIKEQDNRADKLLERMKQQFEVEVGKSMNEIREQLDQLKEKNTELVTIKDQTLATVVQAFEWQEDDDESEMGPVEKQDPTLPKRRFKDVELKSVVSTVVFLPTRDKIDWKQKHEKFAKAVRTALSIYEPERIEGRKILTSRGMMIAAQVELGRHMKLGQIDEYNQRDKKSSALKNFLLVSYKDILWTEMEMIFDEVDPENHGFITEERFRELMHRTSKMGNTKIDFYYKRLRGRNPTKVGVDLNEIANKMFEFADRLETCGCSVILVAVLKEMMKEIQEKREREEQEQRNRDRPVVNVFAPNQGMN